LAAFFGGELGRDGLAAGFAAAGLAAGITLAPGRVVMVAPGLANRVD
jgi:hypothetical protein